MKGFFISLDGLDGTGKTTQCQRLAMWLREQSYTVTTCVDPGGTELGAKLREILLHGRANAMSFHTEAMLFIASRAELVAQVIRPALVAGDIVISDRYALATVVYQGYAGGLNPDEIRQVSHFATGGLEPDVTMVLDLPVAMATQRRGRPADRLEGRSDEYFQKVRSGFLAEAAKQPETIVVIDASADVDTLQERIRQAIAPLLAKRGQ